MRGDPFLNVLCVLPVLAACVPGTHYPGTSTRTGGSSTGGSRNPVCTAGSSTGEVQAPVRVRTLPGETGWFAAPVLADLDHDGATELVTAAYSVAVYSRTLELLDRAEDGSGRVYAPHVVADLDGDGITEVVAGNAHQVLAYEWRNHHLVPKPGWPADTTTAGQRPEVRGLAAADLDGDGRLEVVATTTQTAPTQDGGAQVFVFSANGAPYQPAGITWTAWPRYNAATGTGNDADRNGQGHSGYGCYGLNVAVGNLDDDPDLEVVVTYDNHHVQVFKKDGVAVDASPWFTNPLSEYAGQRLTWGQFIRWADPQVEEDHYHLHTGEWPNPSWTSWLQWTASPPQVADLDGDGHAEVVGIPNVELHDPYVTQAYAVMVLEGAFGDGSRSAMRKPGWEVLPQGDAPILVDGWYPPLGIPAAAVVDLQGDSTLEILASLNDGFLHAFTARGERLWKFNYTSGKAVMDASEPTVADLNQDGSPEVLFTTYGAPEQLDSGHLFILGADGTLLHDVPLDNAGAHNGNGNGAPAAPTVGDLDGDGVLEVFVQTFEHGLEVFRVPGSGTGCIPWPTARGGARRTGAPS